MIPPTRADDDVLERAGRADAQPGAAARRPARPAGREPDRDRAACASSPSATGIESCAPAWPRSSTTPSGAPAPRSTRCPTATREADDVLEGRDGEIAAAPCARRSSGDSLELDFAGSAAAGRGQPQLPALGDPVGLLLRGPGRSATPTRPPPRAPGGRSRCVAPEGSLLNAELAGRGRRRQRRDLEPGRRPRARGAGGAVDGGPARRARGR